MVHMHFICFALAFCLDKIYNTSFGLLSSSGLTVIRAFVVKSSKFQQILARKFTFVILATYFSKALNTKLFKYSLL
jgi:hypothetical protein